MINRVVLIGRITKEIEPKYFENANGGGKVVTFSLAVQRDKENADFINCRAWNKTVDILERYTNKGSQIAVEGSLRQRSWETREGEKRNALEVNVQNVTLLSSRNDSNAQNAQPNTNTYQEPTQANTEDYDISYGDLPF